MGRTKKEIRVPKKKEREECLVPVNEEERRGNPTQREELHKGRERKKVGVEAVNTVFPYYRGERTSYTRLKGPDYREL